MSKQKSKERHEICPLKELPVGERKIVSIGNRSIGVFNIKDSIYAIKNTCPHQGAELCKGTLGGTMAPTDTPGEYNYILDGQVLRCPWHFWEFDVATGEMVFVPHQYRVKTYDVEVEKAANKADKVEEEPRLEHYEVGLEDEMIVVYI